MRQRGSVLVTAVAFMGLCMTLWATSLTRTLHEAQLSSISTNFNQTFSLVEAAVDASLRRLHAGDFTNLPETLLAKGSFSAETLPTGVPLRFTVNAHGVESGIRRNVEAVAQLTATSVFQFALFGANDLTVSGTITTDSFNSAAGPYSPLTAASHGDIGTNAATNGAITINGNVTVNGQVAVGPGASDPAGAVTVSGGSSTVTGSPPFLSMPAPMPMPEVVVPAGLSCSDLTVGGQTTHLLSSAGGPYCFHNLDVKGGGTLSADGPVTVYITGQFSASGSTVVGVPAHPTYLSMLVAHAAEATIESGLWGTSQFYGGLYGPSATIELGGTAEVYGSVIAGHITAPGTVLIHYDQALADLSSPTGFYTTRLLSWRELR